MLYLLLGCGESEKIDPVEEEVVIADADGDGYFEDEDCDDNNSSINVDAIEICDGIDNNCDGAVDEEVLSVFYVDSDGDGFGNPNISIEECEGSTGFVGNASDCDDSDEQSFPGATEICDERDNDCNGEIDDGIGQTFYIDSDNDGFGNEPIETCQLREGISSIDGDCDDSNPSISPVSEEICDDIDNDCNELIDDTALVTFYADNDSDGFGDAENTTEACEIPEGYVVNNTDCNDSDSESFLGSIEVCDGADNDCNNVVDDNPINPSIWYVDSDGDGYGNPDLSSESCDAPTEFYVGNDLDCDDQRDESSPEGSEVCNGYDDNCDGIIDDESASDTTVWFLDSDGDGFGTELVTTDACDQPLGYTGDASDCNDNDEDVFVGAVEVCNDKDDNCDDIVDTDAIDTQAWYLDSDIDGFGNPDVSQQSCEQPAGYVLSPDDCDDENGSINPSELELCDGIDNNCNEVLDEGASDNFVLFFIDNDGDSFGSSDSFVVDCAPPEGYTTNSIDCDDNDMDSNNTDIDADCDGVLTVEDCDDNDSELLHKGDDFDCDGVIAEDDCDDNDASLLEKSNDFDCDGVFVDFDCDDNNSNLLHIVQDRDCDGVITEDDCDDLNISLLEISNDVDCDGVITEFDCDDNDSAYLEQINDQDCDGVLSEDDCDDNDPAYLDQINDLDCDGVVAGEDCDDYDDVLLEQSNDQDCDGILSDDDCNDEDNTLLNQLEDTDCDGFLISEDCDDSDSGVGYCNSCNQILNSQFNTGDGIYQIELPVVGTLDVYCDMTTEGGGWTLAGHQHPTEYFTLTTDNINVDNFLPSRTFRYGNDIIQQMIPTVAWRITTNNTSLTSLTDNAWFKPECVIDWGVYVGSYDGNGLPLDTDCGIAYTDASFTDVVGSSYTEGNCSLGIGQNNSGGYCSLRMGSCGFSGLPDGVAVSCSTGNVSTHSIKLWYK